MPVGDRVDHDELLRDLDMDLVRDPDPAGDPDAAETMALQALGTFLTALEAARRAAHLFSLANAQVQNQPGSE